MENNSKLMRAHSDDVATSFKNKSNGTCEDNKVKVGYRNDCSFNYFGTSSGLSYNDCEDNTFWEY